MAVRTEQDGPDRYVEELPTFSGACLGTGLAGGRTLFSADRGIGFCYASYFCSDLRLRCQISPVLPSSCGADRRLAPAGTDVDADSSGNLHDLLRLGLADLLPGGPPPQGCDGGLRRSQTVDVEVRVRGRTARHQPAARA